MAVIRHYSSVITPCLSCPYQIADLFIILWTLGFLVTFGMEYHVLLAFQRPWHGSVGLNQLQRSVQGSMVCLTHLTQLKLT